MEKCFTIGISSRALFHLEEENTIFEQEGTAAYVRYQMEHEHEILSPGAAFDLICSFLKLNDIDDHKRVEVVIMSKNSADAALRIFNSIDYYGLDITRAALTSGASIAPYLHAYGVDLYLSFAPGDVRAALAGGIAAGLLLPQERRDSMDLDPRMHASGTYKGAIFKGEEREPEIRIAFDGDAVLFSSDAEQIFIDDGMEAFCAQEKALASVPLEPGPFASVLQKLSQLQQETGMLCHKPMIRTALVTARSAPAHERVIRTLQGWGIHTDEAFFMGGMDKSQVLAAFGAHIFFDDNEANVESASTVVLSARVLRPDEVEVIEPGKLAV